MSSVNLDNLVKTNKLKLEPFDQNENEQLLNELIATTRILLIRLEK
jgi:hypothetical protein